MSCLFCDLQKNLENIIYETEKIYVIMDRFPLSDCHLLIIPKEHHDVIYKYDDHIITEIMIVAMFLVRKLQIKSFNLLQNNINGQIIQHCHMHLIEANETGKLSEGSSEILKLNDEKYNSLVLKIKNQIK